MSHLSSSVATLTNGWVVQTHAPDVEMLTKITNEGGKTDPANGGTRIDLSLDIDFTSLDPVVILFDGSAATNQIYSYLDLHMHNFTGQDWKKFNISAIDQLTAPDLADYNYNTAHPFFSHFHNSADNTYDLFPRKGWDSVRGVYTETAPNAWEFSGGGVYQSGRADTLDFENFRVHQYNNGFGGRSGAGTFYVVLTPNRMHIDYSGYSIKEDTQNLDYLGGDNGGSTPRKDMLFGYKGNDLLKGFELDDKLYGGVGNDRLYGGAGSDSLSGGNDSDLLDGGADADVMMGGFGDDIYKVDNAHDIVMEPAGGGKDEIQTSVSYAMPVHVDVLRLMGSASISGKGNFHANTLIGNNAANALNGDGGSDTMVGGGGNDVYYADRRSDVVVEKAHGGLDAVKSSASYTLAAHQEIEILKTTNDAGKSAINLTGNDQTNTIIGNAGANVLDGGLGKDALKGGAGKDTFLFDTRLGSSNLDHVKDFRTVDDTIRLENAVFKALTHTGTLSDDAFALITSKTATVDTDAHILYDRAHGALYYDSNGGSASGRVQFAVLDYHAVLTHHDFFVV